MSDREESRILWGRDYDAIAFGFVLGTLTNMALSAAGVPTWGGLLLTAALVATWIGLALRMTRDVEGR